MDDPWNWSADRISQELTTSQRSWQPDARASPDLQLLRQALEAGNITGQILLTAINHRDDLMELFQVYVVKHQNWLLDAIRQLRSRSPQYQSQLPAPVSQGQAEQSRKQARKDARKQAKKKDEEQANLEVFRCVSNLLVACQGLAKVRTPRVHTSAHRFHARLRFALPSTTTTGTLTRSQSLPADPKPSELVADCAKSDSSQDTASVAAATCTDIEQVLVQSVTEESEVGDAKSTDELSIHIERTPSGPAASSNGNESTSQVIDGSNHEGVDISSSPYLTTSPTVSDDEATFPVPQVESDAQEALRQEVTPKQPKRLAFGMLTTISELDPNRNRDIPTYEDDILGLHLPDPTLAGRKIIAPQLIDRDTVLNSPRIISDDEDSIDFEAATQLQAGDVVQGCSSEAPVVSEVDTRSPRPRSRRIRPVRYLAKEKLSVDDIFYKGIAIGADLPVGSIEAEEKYFSHTTIDNVPTGQVRYANRMMRNFMLSKQNLDRTPSATGPNFSSELLSIDIQRDAHGDPQPEIFADPAIYRVEGDPFSEEAEEESLPQMVSSVDLPEVSRVMLDRRAVAEPDEVVHEAKHSRSVETHAGDHSDDDAAHTFFTAVRTYHEGNGSSGLMTWRTTPSFTLYYRDSTGDVRARREKLVDWPELLGGKDPKQYSPLTPLELIGMRQNVDPEYYLRWEHKPGAEEVDEIIDAKFGYSGSEGEYDTETWKEILSERGEYQRRRTRQKGSALTPAQIDSVLNQAIRTAKEKWTAHQLPKFQKTALRIYRKACRERSRRVQICAIQNDLEALETRLAGIRTEFATIRWTSWSQALKGCRNLEPTVFDMAYLKWKWDLIESKTVPNMSDAPSKIALGTKTISAPAADDAGGDDDAIAYQQEVDDADDDMADFIVNDGEADEEGVGEEEQVVENMEDSDDEFQGDNRLMKGWASSDQPGGNGVKTPARKSGITKRPSEVIDLTDSPPLASTSDISAAVIDLTTPAKKLTTFKGLKPESISPLASGSKPPLNNPSAIAEFPYAHWEKSIDRVRLLIKLFYELEGSRSRSLLHLFKRYSPDELWARTKTVVIALQAEADHAIGMKTSTFDRLTEIVQLLLIFMECKYYNLDRHLTYDMLKVVIELERNWLYDFHGVCSRIDSYLHLQKPYEAPSPSPVGKIDQVNKRQFIEIIDDDEEEPTKRRRIRGSVDNDEDDEDDDDFEESVPSPSSTRKRPVIEDANARAARERNKQRLAEQEDRRAKLKAKLAESGNTFSQGTTKHMINDAADVDQGPVFVNEDIGRRIKKHQVEGVRFMWNQVVAVTDEHSMQGCLLAHTMGLGKTMQVITLLVAVAEASSSSDSSISSQVPTSLKGKLKSLVLCPPGLVDNWMDELLFWTPGDVLGDLWKLSNLPDFEDRLQSISDWHENGGVLIIGYEMLRNLIQNKPTKKRDALSPEAFARLRKQLLDGPDIIIADEAHKLKNSKANIAIVASQFRTKCRIALTGSPLANNVEEYYSMIEFIQPGYLGSAVEFRSKFKEPIEAGMFSDSDPAQIRQARKMLTVLNEELALKVQRADLSVLKNDLPLKKEFVISVPLTELQRKVYSLYVQSLKVLDHEVTKDGQVKQTTLWSWLAMLSLLCNHPFCFNTKIHEDKDAISKQSSPDSPTDDEVTLNLIDISASKARLSTAFVEEVTRLFQVEDLTQVNLSNKVKVLCQILDAAKEAGDKTLVFSSSIPTLDFLESLFEVQGRSLFRLDGKTKMTTRQGLVKTYNSGSTEVFLISTTAGGLGLNLQSANRVVIFDFKYNPIQEEQAVGRAYRIGQLKPTFVYRFVCGGTFEDNIHNKTLFKSQLATRVVDKKRVQAMAKKKFGDFLFEPKELQQKDLSKFRGMDPAVLDKILALQAETATIMSIVQTDSFAVDEEYEIPPEDIMEVSRYRGEMKIQRQAGKAASQLPNGSHTEASPSKVPQASGYGSVPVSNRSAKSVTSQTHITGPDTFRNAQTPNLPPRPRYPQGFSGARSSQAGQSPPVDSELNSSPRFDNRPIMGAGTRFEADRSSLDSCNTKTQPRRVSDLGARLNSQGVVGQGAPEVSFSGQYQQDGSPKASQLWPALRNAWESNAGGDSHKPQIPVNFHLRTRDIARDIRVMVRDRTSDDLIRRNVYMQKAFDTLSADTAKARQLINATLSIADFVEDLMQQTPSSDTNQVGISEVSPFLQKPPFIHEAPEVGVSQGFLTASTSSPISNIQGLSRHLNPGAFYHHDAESYASNSDLSIIGARQGPKDFCRNEEQNLRAADDSSMYRTMSSQFSSTQHQGPKTPAKQACTATNRSHILRDEDAQIMADIDRKRKSKGDLPLAKGPKLGNFRTS
ncbi:uncharacterized protein RAG0_08155 [Rhynchosporium agropyri]|uniref:DNA repair protein rhp54 n=1 Tax=Rhynchosporium agropyri TaxID=914238 RepID=A0A1E1KPD5_9HELO|nr:uncharacterized protein RAG0_08155 [Rhynchosporium agropyri]